MFVCQRRDIVHYANDFLWRKSFIAFSIPVLEDVTSGKKLVIILEKCSALSLLLAKHLKLPQEEQEYSEATDDFYENLSWNDYCQETWPG